MKHAPGPWEWITDERKERVLLDAAGESVIWLDSRFEPRGANARLIAAAPELLTLLQKIRTRFKEAADQKQDFDWLVAHCFLQDIDPLVRKIEGE